MNADEDIINFQNGILKITATDTELIPHSADILSTIQLPCEWSDEDIDTPVFDSYMDTITNGDEMVKQLLMEFIGVCISNECERLADEKSIISCRAGRYREVTA